VAGFLVMLQLSMPPGHPASLDTHASDSGCATSVSGLHPVTQPAPEAIAQPGRELNSKQAACTRVRH
jgi:hypothetical protein